MSSTKLLTIALALIVAGCSQQSDDKKGAAPAPAPAVVPTPVSAIQISYWGPKSTPAGKGFNVQPTGYSALWFEWKGIGNNTVEVWLGDHKLERPVVDPERAGSAEIAPEWIAKPGRFPLYLIVKPSGARVDIGTFEVTAP